MAEFQQRRQDVEKCMRRHDQWLAGSTSTTDGVEAVEMTAMAHAARTIAADIARCDLGSPLVSTDKAVRDKAWQEQGSL